LLRFGGGDNPPEERNIPGSWGLRWWWPRWWCGQASGWCVAGHTDNGIIVARASAIGRVQHPEGAFRLHPKGRVHGGVEAVFIPREHLDGCSEDIRGRLENQLVSMSGRLHHVLQVVVEGGVAPLHCSLLTKSGGKQTGVVWVLLVRMLLYKLHKQWSKVVSFSHHLKSGKEAGSIPRNLEHIHRSKFVQVELLPFQLRWGSLTPSGWSSDRVLLLSF